MNKIVQQLLVATLFLGLAAGSYWAYQMRSMGFLRAPAYDTVAPTIPALEHPALLVLNKTNGYIHKEALPAAGRLLDELAIEEGWHLYTTDNAASHNVQDLARFDVVIWNNTSGDLLTTEQRAAFKTWLEGGGGWLGLHAAGGDPGYVWEWYPNTLLGAQFIGHTMSPQFQDAEVLVAAHSPLTDHLPQPWRIAAEEWYAFDRNPRGTGSQILLTLDENSYDPGNTNTVFPDTHMPGEHPIAWTHPSGDGTVIYLALGHTAATYALPAYRELVRRAIRQLIDRPQ